MVINPFHASFDRREVIDFPDMCFHYELSVVLYKKPSAEQYQLTIFYRVSYIFYIQPKLSQNSPFFW